MKGPIYWDEQTIRYVSTRSSRYTGALDIETEWAEEVLEDFELLVLDPDPKSRIGATRLIGWSRRAGRVLVVIVYRDLDGDLHGITCGRRRAGI